MQHLCRIALPKLWQKEREKNSPKTGKTGAKQAAQNWSPTHRTHRKPAAPPHPSQNDKKGDCIYFLKPSNLD